MKKEFFAKKELPHKKLDKVTNNNSARYVMKIGLLCEDKLSKSWFKKHITLIDKICYPPNECSHCKSKATFHRRMQQHGEVMNIWRIERKEDSSCVIVIKYDFCLDCHTEFVFEMFIYKKL